MRNKQSMTGLTGAQEKREQSREKHARPGQHVSKEVVSEVLEKWLVHLSKDPEGVSVFSFKLLQSMQASWVEMLVT